MTEIHEIKPHEVTSDAIADLEPKTNREHLMILWLTQQRILGHLEDLNDVKQDLSNLKGQFKVAVGVIGAGVIGLAIKEIFGS